MATFKRLKGFLFLSALALVLYFSALFVFPPVFLLLLLPYGVSMAAKASDICVSTYYKLSPVSLETHHAKTLLFFTFQTETKALLELVFGIKVKICGNLKKLDGPCLLIMNHRTRLDWMFLWCYLMRLGDIKLLKIVLKKALKKVPIVGWSMQSAQYIFITRKWDEDKELIKENLSYFTEIEYPLQLLLFPEGTDLSLTNKKKNQKYAEDNGLQKYEYVLHPRTKGFCLCLQELRKGKTPPTIVNISVGYLGDIPQNEKDIYAGNWPDEIHFHSELIASSELPSDDEGVSKWLQERWEEKENQLELFYSNKKFSDRYLSEEKIRESYGEMKKVMLIWTLFLCYIFYRLSQGIFYWMYYPIITTLYFILNHFTDGIDRMILRRYRLFNFKKDL